MALQVEETALNGVLLITPAKFGDARGFFSETYNADSFQRAGITSAFVQDNQSLSAAKGVLRGLHFQAPPYAQAKLVRCTKGAIFDVAVDIRTDSPNFGKWVGAEISASNWKQIFVPRGFAHGFVTLTPDCEVQYKVDNFYNAEADGGLAWDDPQIAIDWPIDEGLTLSDKDKLHPTLSNFQSPFTMENSK